MRIGSAVCHAVILGGSVDINRDNIQKLIDLRTYLNLRTAQATGLPVFAGPVEGTAIGNLFVQLISSNDLLDLQTARDTERVSFDIIAIAN